MSLKQVKQRIDKFNKDRDWDQFHTPSNLAKSSLRLNYSILFDKLKAIYYTLNNLNN